MSIVIKTYSNTLAGHRVSQVDGILVLDTRTPGQRAADIAEFNILQPIREARGVVLREQRLLQMALRRQVKRR